MRLKGKAIIVTGSTTGIGQVIARTFATEGASVLIHGTDQERAMKTASELGDQAELHVDDLSNPAAPSRIVATAISAFGRLDALVNNAAWVPKSDIETVSVDQWSRVMAINALAPLLLTKAALPHLAKTHGAVLNIGSVNAYCGEHGLLDYSMSKGALQTMSRNLGDALHLEYGVRVNQINPGWVLTPNEVARKKDHGVKDGWETRVPKQFAPTGSIIDPQVIADAAIFWVSDESRSISGSVVELEQYPMIGRNPSKAES